MARGADSAGYCQTDACHVPLPQIQNGERKAYALKSKELTGPTKGVIFLEIDVIFNAVSPPFAFFDSPPWFFFFYILPPPTPSLSSPSIPLVPSTPHAAVVSILFVTPPPSLPSHPSSLVPRPRFGFNYRRLPLNSLCSPIHYRCVCPAAAILQLSLPLSLASDLGHARHICCSVLSICHVLEKHQEIIKM